MGLQKRRGIAASQPGSNAAAVAFSREANERIRTLTQVAFDGQLAETRVAAICMRLVELGERRSIKLIGPLLFDSAAKTERGDEPPDYPISGIAAKYFDLMVRKGHLEAPSVRTPSADRVEEWRKWWAIHRSQYTTKPLEMEISDQGPSFRSSETEDEVPTLPTSGDNSFVAPSGDAVPPGVPSVARSGHIEVDGIVASTVTAIGIIALICGVFIYFRKIKRSRK